MIQRALEPREDLGSMLASGGLRAVYQPIVDLDSRATVAYEALARGPVGSPFESPLAMFTAAEAEGQTMELDRRCRLAAVDGARQAHLGDSAALFVNVEPTSMAAGFGHEVVGAAGDVRIVLEITERAIIAHPGDLLAAVAEARNLGYAIAIDDLGADDAALALLPFIAPEVMKLDLRLIQDQPGRDVGPVGECRAGRERTQRRHRAGRGHRERRPPPAGPGGRRPAGAGLLPRPPGRARRSDQRAIVVGRHQRAGDGLDRGEPL